MFVTQEDWGTCPAVGSQVRAEALGFEQRKILGLFFSPPAKPRVFFIFYIKVWKKQSAAN